MFKNSNVLLVLFVSFCLSCLKSSRACLHDCTHPCQLDEKATSRRQAAAPAFFETT